MDVVRAVDELQKDLTASMGLAHDIPWHTPSWLLRALGELLKQYPGGVTRSIVHTELARRWRADSTPKNLTELLELRVWPVDVSMELSVVSVRLNGPIANNVLVTVADSACNAQADVIVSNPPNALKSLLIPGNCVRLSHVYVRKSAKNTLPLLLAHDIWPAVELSEDHFLSLAPALNNPKASPIYSIYARVVHLERNYATLEPYDPPELLQFSPEPSPPLQLPSRLLLPVPSSSILQRGENILVLVTKVENGEVVITPKSVVVVHVPSTLPTQTLSPAASLPISTLKRDRYLLNECVSVGPAPPLLVRVDRIRRNILAVSDSSGRANLIVHLDNVMSRVRTGHYLLLAHVNILPGKDDSGCPIGLRLLSASEEHGSSLTVLSLLLSILTSSYLFRRTCLKAALQLHELPTWIGVARIIFIRFASSVKHTHGMCGNFMESSSVPAECKTCNVIVDETAPVYDVFWTLDDGTLKVEAPASPAVCQTLIERAPLDFLALTETEMMNSLSPIIDLECVYWMTRVTQNGASALRIDMIAPPCEAFEQRLATELRWRDGKSRALNFRPHSPATSIKLPPL